MIYYIKGTITHKTPDHVVIEAADGIGYEVGVTTSALAELAVDKPVKLFTYLVVKEDEMSLYGWTDPAQRAMFLRLISISGVGPKLAQTVLSGMSVGDLALCISCGDAESLTKVKGVGKKTGERIVLELKDKLADEFIKGGGMGSIIKPGGSVPQTFGKLEDAVMALMSLGLGRAEAHTAVTAVAKDGMTVEDIVFASLKGMK